MKTLKTLLIMLMLLQMNACSNNMDVPIEEDDPEIESEFEQPQKSQGSGTYILDESKTIIYAWSIDLDDVNLRPLDQFYPNMLNAGYSQIDIEFSKGELNYAFASSIDGAHSQGSGAYTWDVPDRIVFNMPVQLSVSSDASEVNWWNENDRKDLWPGFRKFYYTVVGSYKPYQENDWLAIMNGQDFSVDWHSSSGNNILPDDSEFIQNADYELLIHTNNDYAVIGLVTTVDANNFACKIIYFYNRQ